MVGLILKRRHYSLSVTYITIVKLLMGFPRNFVVGIQVQPRDKVLGRRPLAYVRPLLSQ